MRLVCGDLVHLFREDVVHLFRGDVAYLVHGGLVCISYVWCASNMWRCVVYLVLGDVVYVVRGDLWHYHASHKSTGTMYNPIGVTLCVNLCYRDRYSGIEVDDGRDGIYSRVQQQMPVQVYAFLSYTLMAVLCTV